MAMSLNDLVDEALAVVEEITPTDAARLLDEPDRGGWHFVDVRESDEYATGHVPGARHSPRGFLEVHADLEHPKRDPWFGDRDRPIICYCGGGNRSALAAQSLGRMGFTRVRSLAGGWTDWTAAKLPIES